MTTLLDDAFFNITFDPRQGICRITRTAAPFDTTADCVRAHEAVADAVRAVPSGSVTTFDVRNAPSRNDPAFERVVVDVNARMFRPFTRVAFLARSAAGRLHIKRLTQNVAAAVEVFVDESQALLWLREPVARRRV